MYADRSKYPLPDVVLTDLRMGNESGLDLVEWIRQQPSPLRETKVVILTGSASAIQFEAAEKIGAQKVYRKPTRLEDLRDLMTDVAAELGPKANERPPTDNDHLISCLESCPPPPNQNNRGSYAQNQQS